MTGIYKFFGGRKMYYFHLLLIVNAAFLAVGKWTEGFGYFSIGIYVTIVIGVEGNKFIKNKFSSQDNDK